MSQTLIWSLGLLLLAAVCLLLEFLIPSAGLLGIGAGLALVAALFLAFTDSTSAGVVMTVVVVVAVPILLGLAVRLWPRTPIGRRILNLPADNLEGTREREDDRIVRLRQLVGRVGTARTDMLPSGLIEIDGRRYDALAQGTAINRDSFVEVFSVEAGRIRVRPTNRRPGALEPADAAHDPQSLAQRSLDELDLEDLGDPLA